MKHKPIVSFPDIKVTHYPSQKDGKTFLVKFTRKVQSKGCMVSLAQSCPISPDIKGITFLMYLT